MNGSLCGSGPIVLLLAYVEWSDSVFEGGGAHRVPAALCVFAGSVSHGQLAAYADPVNYITHFTGDWALWLLLATLAVTPLRRLHPSLAWMIRFRRMLGLYAFFYATLHLLTYVFLFSGYDMPAAIDGCGTWHS